MSWLFWTSDKKLLSIHLSVTINNTARFPNKCYAYLNFLQFIPFSPSWSSIVWDDSVDSFIVLVGAPPSLFFRRFRPERMTKIIAYLCYLQLKHIQTLAKRDCSTNPQSVRRDHAYPFMAVARPPPQIFLGQIFSYLPKLFCFRNLLSPPRKFCNPPPQRKF